MENTTRIEGDQLVSERRISLDSYIKSKEGEIEHLQLQINELLSTMNDRLLELKSLSDKE